MNPTVSAIGMALNMRFERSPLGLNLQAHQDTAGNWQIGDGLTELVDGTPVTKGMTLTPAEYEVQSKTDLRAREQRVLDLVKVEMNQYQFDALVLLAYNIGLDAFENSDVLEMVNAGRWEDAAYHFGDWVYATIRNKFDADGSVIGEPKYGPDGVLLADGVIWKRAYRGLYRRHLSEACLALGFDSAEACDDEIELESEPEKTSYGWRDEVIYKTPWADVLRIAEKHPLPAPRLLTSKEEPVMAETELPQQWDKLTPKQQTAFLNMTQEAKLKSAVPAKVSVKAAKSPIPVEHIEYLDDEAKTEVKVKRIKDSQRGKGNAKQEVAKVMGVTAVGGMAAESIGAVEPSIKFIEKYSFTSIGLVFGVMALVAVLYHFYGKWQEQKGRDEADTLLG